MALAIFTCVCENRSQWSVFTIIIRHADIVTPIGNMTFCPCCFCIDIIVCKIITQFNGQLTHHAIPASRYQQIHGIKYNAVDNYKESFWRLESCPLYIYGTTNKIANGLMDTDWDQPFIEVLLYVLCSECAHRESNKVPLRPRYKINIICVIWDTYIHANDVADALLDTNIDKWWINIDVMYLQTNKFFWDRPFNLKGRGVSNLLTENYLTWAEKDILKALYVWKNHSSPPLWVK